MSEDGLYNLYLCTCEAVYMNYCVYCGFEGLEDVVNVYVVYACKADGDLTPAAARRRFKKWFKVIVYLRHMSR